MAIQDAVTPPSDYRIVSTTAIRDTISPKKHGLLVYVQANTTWYKWTGSAWETLEAALTPNIDHDLLNNLAWTSSGHTGTANKFAGFDGSGNADELDAPVPAHNDTTGKQGGTTNEYYHLTQAQETDLTDAGDSALHYHSTDRARANHTGTQVASTISDFDTEVSNNTDVAANTTHRGLTNNPHSVTATQVGKDTAQWNADELSDIPVPSSPGSGDDEKFLKYDHDTTSYVLDTPSGAADELIKVSSNDTTSKYLLPALVGGTNVTLTEQNDGGNETIKIDAAAGAFAPGNNRMVAVSGASYTTISSAMSAASAGDSIFVYSGTYTETITFSQNNISIIGVEGERVTITQANANVIDTNGKSGCVIENCTISTTAVTSDVDCFDGAGNLTLKNCFSSANITGTVSAAAQPALYGGSHALTVQGGTASYSNAGSFATARKSAVSKSAGSIKFYDVLCDMTTTNTGSIASFFDELNGGSVDVLNNTHVTGTVNATSNFLWYFDGSNTRDIRNSTLAQSGTGVGYAVYGASGATSTINSFNSICNSSVGSINYNYNLVVAAGSTVNCYGDQIVSTGTNFPRSGGTVNFHACLVNGTLVTDNLNINNAYTMPNADGSVNQVLTTNGGGTVTFQTPGGGIFGSQFYSYSSTGLSTTTSGSYQYKINQTTASIPAGTYFVSWSMSGWINGGDCDMVASVGATTVKYGEEPALKPNSFAGSMAYTHGGGTITVRLGYKVGGSGTAYAQYAYMTLWRIN